MPSWIFDRGRTGRPLAQQRGKLPTGNKSDLHDVSYGSQREVALFGLMSASPSRPGEFRPEPLTEPDLTLSRHPARATARRLPPSIEHRVPPKLIPEEGSPPGFDII